MSILVVAFAAFAFAVNPGGWVRPIVQIGAVCLAWVASRRVDRLLRTPGQTRLMQGVAVLFGTLAFCLIAMASAFVIGVDVHAPLSRWWFWIPPAALAVLAFSRYFETEASRAK